jgi:hypothetical protein
MATHRAGFFPTMVAKELGIRGERSSPILVSKNSCELIRLAQASGGKKDSTICSTEEWSELEAVILSNVGDRWLLEIDGKKLLNGDSQRFRLALPRNDIQVLHRTVDRRTALKSTNCSK